jgi:hypothetical protein
MAVRSQSHSCIELRPPCDAGAAIEYLERWSLRLKRGNAAASWMSAVSQRIAVPEGRQRVDCGFLNFRSRYLRPAIRVGASNSRRSGRSRVRPVPDGHKGLAARLRAWRVPGVTIWQAEAIEAQRRERRPAVRQASPFTRSVKGSGTRAPGTGGALAHGAVHRTAAGV